MTKALLFSAALIGLCVGTVQAQETPFGQPAKEYLQAFAKPGQKLFVYERYDASGKLYRRDIKPISGKVEISSATERKINGVAYRLRGLSACPHKNVKYLNKNWNCNEAAADSQSLVYDRASVVMCKTLKLRSEPNSPDPVSCFSLVGDGTSNDPYGISYDDDDVVFLGLAGIIVNDKGQTMRPDLREAQRLSGALGNKDAL